MTTKQTRFSRRQLLALCTFLVPLAVLAVLGHSELQRSGAEADAALEREARQFLQSASQTLDQQFDRSLPPVVAESQRLLAEHGPVRTVLMLREQERYTTLLDILLLDEQLGLVWPGLPPASLDLPFARDAGERGADNSITAALQAVDLLLVHDDRQTAKALLQHLIAQIGAANPPDRGARRSELEIAEVQARFRLATVHRALGDAELARVEFERCSRYAPAATRAGRIDQGTATLAVLAEAALAEQGTSADRLRILRTIAEGRRDGLADGLLAAIADRLASGITAEDPAWREAEMLRIEERQREQTRSFAGAYDLVLKFGLRLRRMRQANLGEFDAETDEEPRIVSTIAGQTTILCVRRATPEEAQAFRCRRVGVHVDLERLLAPALESLAASGTTFVLAIEAPDDVPMVPPPTTVPEGFVPPRIERHGLLLQAFPANAAQLIADTNAAGRNRTALMLALFTTAVGGALWLWRSVAREAELAALKIDLVSRVSHELKTPLALIRMYGETLGMGRARDSNQASQFGGIIARESERLTAMIQRILDFSRLQAGTMTYETKVIDLGQVLRTICDAYTPHLEARGAILVETLPHEVFVRCDVNACEGAVINLLENAAKYGPEGEPESEIELELSTDGDMARIEVRDHGRGVPAAERDRIFEGFYRASNSGEVRGAGIGLSLVRHFARAHGGEIAAEPRSGGGTIFRLTLPLASRPTDATQGEPPLPPPPVRTEPQSRP